MPKAPVGQVGRTPTADSGDRPQNPDSIESASKSQQAYQAIHSRITGGQLAPGYRLVLSTLAKELGFSTVPVREAIRRLEAEGLVAFEQNVGATVAAIDPTLYLHTMQTLAIIEGAATGLASPKLTAEDVENAREINREMRKSLQEFDPQRFTALNTTFHEVLYGRCPNPHILELVHRGWNRLNAIRTSSFEHIPGRAHRSVEEHDALLDLIAAHADPHRIEEAARAHRMATLNAYLEHVRQPPSVL